MKISSINQKWTDLFLTVLTGSIMATSAVAMLVSQKIGAMQLAYWQIAAIYVVSIATCVLSGVKGITKECRDGADFGKPMPHHRDGISAM